MTPPHRNDVLGRVSRRSPPDECDFKLEPTLADRQPLLQLHTVDDYGGHASESSEVFESGGATVVVEGSRHRQDAKVVDKIEGVLSMERQQERSYPGLNTSGVGDAAAAAAATSRGGLFLVKYYTNFPSCGCRYKTDWTYTRRGYFCKT